MSNVKNCGCDEFVHPRPIDNPPGQRMLRYRAGDFLSFRHALLSSRAGERHLPAWRPGAEGDLAVQLVEWWAYLADVLTFYNERRISEAYLGTAADDESVRNLTRLLGYRPRPGIGARGSVAAILSGTAAVTLPPGFKIDSKPGPGKTPQTFETDFETTIAPPDVVTIEPASDNAAVAKIGDAWTLLLRGTVTITRGDRFLLLPRAWNGDGTKGAIVTADHAVAERDPRGNRNTRLVFQEPVDVAGSATDFRLLRNTQSARVRPGTGAITATEAHLDSVRRDLAPLSPLIIDSDKATLVQGTTVTETLYYANGQLPDFLKPPLNPQTEIPIPVPSTKIAFAGGPSSATGGATTIAFAFVDVGEIIGTPGASLTPIVTPAAPLQLSTPKTMLVEDAAGHGAMATVSSVSDGTLQLAGLSPEAPRLAAPLRLITNLLSVSRGKSVLREVLGSGDAAAAGQDFVLRNAPVTYLPDHESRSGDGYSSTIQLDVDGVRWHEVRSFFGQPPTARVFVTSEDAEGKTHVRTGDGINGARLPSGTDNVVASYRFGSGAEAPEAGKLTVVAKPWPGLRAIHNPVPVGGGDDPEGAANLRERPPRTVLTFGRAVSGDDFEAIAASTPGVSRVRASWSFDPDQQRTHLTLYVAGDDVAVAEVKNAIAGAGEADEADVVRATPTALHVDVRVAIDPDRDPAIVIRALRAALADREHGIFGAKATPIGRPIYRSAVFAACLSVPGTVAVPALTVRMRDFVRPKLSPFLAALLRGGSAGLLTGYRYDAGDAAFFTLDDHDLQVSTEPAHG